MVAFSVATVPEIFLPLSGNCRWIFRCAKVSPGASTSPAAPPNSAAPSPRELGARSRGAARTFCGAEAHEAAGSRRPPQTPPLAPDPRPAATPEHEREWPFSCAFICISRLIFQFLCRMSLVFC
jgi:hypothetical protein